MYLENVYHIYLGKKVPYVLKSWKAEYFNQGFKMEDCVRIHIKAYELANEFRKVLPASHPIVFKKPTLHTMTETIVRNSKRIFVKVRRDATTCNNNKNAAQIFAQFNLIVCYTWLNILSSFLNMDKISICFYSIGIMVV